MNEGNMDTWVVYTTSGTFIGRVRAVDAGSAIRASLARVNQRHQHVNEKALRAKPEPE